MNQITRKIEANRDNEGLVPLGNDTFIIGYIDEVNGSNAQETTYAPTQHELKVLVKFWAQEILDDEYFYFLFGQAGSTEIRRRAFANRRIQRIQEILGEEADNAIEEVREKFKQNIDPEVWRIFTSGSEKEMETIRDNIQNEMEAESGTI